VPPLFIGAFCGVRLRPGPPERRQQALVRLGGDAGLRSDEMTALEWTDIDSRQQLLTVARSEWKGHVTLPKGGRARKVPMTTALAAALQKLKRLRGPRVLWADRGGDGTQKVLRTWMAAQKRAGLKDNGGVHILRHTLLFALGHARRTGDGHQGARRARQPGHNAAVHAPLARGQGQRDPAADVLRDLEGHDALG
jgi:integrase